MTCFPLCYWYDDTLVEFEGVDDNQDDDGDRDNSPKDADHSYGATDHRLGGVIAVTDARHGDDHQPHHILDVIKSPVGVVGTSLADTVAEGKEGDGEEEEDDDQLDGGLLEVALDSIEDGVVTVVDAADTGSAGALELEGVHEMGDENQQLPHGEQH